MLLESPLVANPPWHVNIQHQGRTRVGIAPDTSVDTRPEYFSKG